MGSFPNFLAKVKIFFEAFFYFMIMIGGKEVELSVILLIMGRVFVAGSVLEEWNFVGWGIWIGGVLEKV